MMKRWRVVLYCVCYYCRESRVTFDTSDTKKTFGPIVIDYTAVQSKVNLKYDNIQKSVLTQFGSHLGENMNDFYGNIAKVNQQRFI